MCRQTASRCRRPTAERVQSPSYCDASWSKAAITRSPRSCFDLMEGGPQPLTGGQNSAGIRICSHLGFQKFIRVAIKLFGMPAAKLNLAVRAGFPRANAHQAGRDLIEVRRSFDGIRNGGEKDVGAALLDVIHGGLNVGDLLAFVAPHEEHAGLDAVLFAKRNSLPHLLHLYTALHSVQNALRTAFRSDPDTEASQRRQRFCDA